jgi:hypothetical protein
MLITSHAKVRWLERIERMDLTCVRRELEARLEIVYDADIIAFLRAREGLDDKAIEALIHSNPKVREACAMGASSVRIEDFRICFAEGKVVTVTGTSARCPVL